MAEWAHNPFRSLNPPKTRSIGTPACSTTEQAGIFLPNVGEKVWIWTKIRIFCLKNKLSKVFFGINLHYSKFFLYDSFFERLHGVVLHVLENDLPQVEDISYTTIEKIKRMLMILAERVPLMPKMVELYRELETNRDNGLRMLALLDRAGLLALYSHEVINLNSLNKPDKIFLNNPNLMYCLSTHIDKGTLRETFFYDQLRCISEVLMPKKGDFWINKEYLFEVGGKSKTFEQIKDEPNSFLAIDEVETGHFNRIPLWLFGFLY